MQSPAELVRQQQILRARFEKQAADEDRVPGDEEEEEEEEYEHKSGDIAYEAPSAASASSSSSSVAAASASSSSSVVQNRWTDKHPTKKGGVMHPELKAQGTIKRCGEDLLLVFDHLNVHLCEPWDARTTPVETLHAKLVDLSREHCCFVNHMTYLREPGLIHIRLDAHFTEVSAACWVWLHDCDLPLVQSFQWGAKTLNGKIYAFTTNKAAFSPWMHECILQNNKLIKFKDGVPTHCVRDNMEVEGDAAAAFALHAAQPPPPAEDLVQIRDSDPVPNQNGELQYGGLQKQSPASQYPFGRFMLRWKVSGKNQSSTTKIKSLAPADVEAAKKKLVDLRQTLIAKMHAQRDGVPAAAAAAAAPAAPLESRPTWRALTPGSTLQEKSQLDITANPQPNSLYADGWAMGPWLSGSITKHGPNTWCARWGPKKDECKHCGTEQHALNVLITVNKDTPSLAMNPWKKFVLDHENARGIPSHNRQIRLKHNDALLPYGAFMMVSDDDPRLLEAMNNHCWMAEKVDNFDRANPKYRPKNIDPASEWPYLDELIVWELNKTMKRENGHPLWSSKQDMMDALHIWNDNRIPSDLRKQKIEISWLKQTRTQLARQRKINAHKRRTMDPDDMMAQMSLLEREADENTSGVEEYNERYALATSALRSGDSYASSQKIVKGETAAAAAASYVSSQKIVKEEAAAAAAASSF